MKNIKGIYHLKKLRRNSRIVVVFQYFDKYCKFRAATVIENM